MSFEFSKNLGKTIDLSRENFREYIKTDFKYILKPIIVLFLSILLFFTIFLVPNIGNANSLILFFLFDILIIFISFVWLSYLVYWLTVSKAYHVLSKYENFKHTYEETLQYTINYRRRAFFSALIAGVLTGVVIGIIEIGGIIGLFIFVFSLTNSGTAAIFLGIVLYGILYIGLLLFSFIKLIPLQLYPTIMVIEPKLGYQEGLRKSFAIMSGWKNRVKYLICQLLLSYIVSFVSQFVFMGIFFASLFAGLMVLVIFNISGLLAVIFLILLVLISIFVYFIGLFELQNIILGNFYGQSYVNLVRPDLLPTQKTYGYPQTRKSTIEKYCVSCGQPLTSEHLFCPNCGAPVKSK